MASQKPEKAQKGSRTSGYNDELQEHSTADIEVSLSFLNFYDSDSTQRREKCRETFYMQYARLADPAGI